MSGDVFSIVAEHGSRGHAVRSRDVLQGRWCSGLPGVGRKNVLGVESVLKFHVIFTIANDAL
jgi:hypothetical protein